MSLGQGVFVLEPVKQGSLIWRCKDTIDQLMYFMNDQNENNCVRYRMDENVVCFKGEQETLAHLENLSSYEDRLPKNFGLTFVFIVHSFHTLCFVVKVSLCCRRYFVEHSYHDGGLLNHILDDGKLVNHSGTPNAGPGDGLV